MSESVERADASHDSEPHGSPREALVAGQTDPARIAAGMAARTQFVLGLQHRVGNRATARLVQRQARHRPGAIPQSGPTGSSSAASSSSADPVATPVERSEFTPELPPAGASPEPTADPHWSRMMLRRHLASVDDAQRWGGDVVMLDGHVVNLSQAEALAVRAAWHARFHQFLNQAGNDIDALNEAHAWDRAVRVVASTWQHCTVHFVTDVLDRCRRDQRRLVAVDISGGACKASLAARVFALIWG